MTKYFVPQPDITAYDLAQLVANFGGIEPPGSASGIVFGAAQWSGLPDTLKRHFADVPMPLA